MVKTRYTKADPNHMAEVGPVGPRWEGDPCELSVWPSRVGRKVFPAGL